MTRDSLVGSNLVLICDKYFSHEGFPPLVDVERENFVGDDQTSKGFSLFSDQIGRAEKKESIDLLHKRLEIFQIPISLERTRQGGAKRSDQSY